MFDNGDKPGLHIKPLPGLMRAVKKVGKKMERTHSFRKKICGFMLMGLFFIVPVSAYEISFKVTPGAMLPFLSADKYYAPVGFNGFFETGINVTNFMNVGLSLGGFVMPKNQFEELEEGTSKVLLFFPLGVRMEFFAYPWSRVELSGGLGFGIAMGINSVSRDDIRTMYAPWYKAYGDVMFRVNPNLSLGLNVTWFNYQSHSWFGEPGMAGLSVGISAKFKLETEKLIHRVKITSEQDDRVFPLISTMYKENQIGTLYIENGESAEIQNVRVSFRADGYTASDLLCGVVDKIFKGETRDVPLLADFNNRIMQFSEAGDIPGEVIIEYELLGKKLKTIEPVIVSVYNRNQVRWMDPQILAAYISSTSEDVIKLSKTIVGVARNQLRSGLNRNLQFAMYLFEGIRLSGIECKADNATPYEEYHMDDELLDYIQYPAQTMLYKSGDVDDLGILFMALLEAAGIEAGYIPLSNDFIVLIDMNQAESKIGAMMDGTDRAIIIDEKVWIPVSMSTLKEGFVNSWYNAINELMEGAENDEDESFYMVKDGWSIYPPASFTGSGSFESPLEANLIAAVEIDMSRYITTEYGPQIAAVQYQMKEQGISVELLNKLGLLYVRAGIYSSAIPVYERAAAMGSVAAMNNLGNIAVLQNRYVDAKDWYERALAIEPSNATALKGLNRVLGKLED